MDTGFLDSWTPSLRLLNVDRVMLTPLNIVDISFVDCAYGAA